MHTPIRDKKSARKVTLAAQAAALVLLAGGVAVTIAGVPEVGAPAPPAPAEAADQPDRPTQPGVDQAATAPAVDPTTVSELLALVQNAPVTDAEATAETDPTTPVVATEDPGPGVRYVGSIKVGGRASAFMNIGGVTKLLRPGGEPYSRVRLLRVEGDEVVVSIGDGPETRIEKAARSGSAVSLVVGGAPAGIKEPATALGDDSPEPADFTPDMSRDERRQALIERARSERGRWERQRGEGGGPPN